MPGTRQVTGARGERAAARFLRRRGLAIVARNYRCASGEIDLVALDGGVVVFVEVKTRRAEDFGEPLAAVDPRKQRQVARVALNFLARYGLLNREVRFDVVGVSPTRWGFCRCTHVRNAFDAPPADEIRRRRP